MGDYFTMARYHNQYIDACTELSRMKERVENLKDFAAAGYDVEEELPEAEEALRHAKEEVGRLWYLSSTGKPKPETPSGTTIPLSPFGNPISPQ